MTSSTAASSAADTRERSLAIVSAWTLSLPTLPVGIMPDSHEERMDLALDLGLLAAAFLHGWSACIGVLPNDLLTDIALGQALDHLTREAAGE